MAKVDYDIIRSAVRVADVDDSKARRIFAAIDDMLTQEEIARADKEPAVKKQFVVIVNDPYGKIPETGFEFSGWVMQIPEDADPRSALVKLAYGAYDFNATPKGRRMPLKTIDEAARFGSARIYKEHKLWIKTKEPVLVIPTDGKIGGVKELED